MSHSTLRPAWRGAQPSATRGVSRSTLRHAWSEPHHLLPRVDWIILIVIIMCLMIRSQVGSVKQQMSEPPVPPSDADSESESEETWDTRCSRCQRDYGLKKLGRDVIICENCWLAGWRRTEACWAASCREQLGCICIAGEEGNPTCPFCWSEPDQQKKPGDKEPGDKEPGDDRTGNAGKRRRSSPP